MIKNYYTTVSRSAIEETDTPRPGSWINIENATTQELEYVTNLTGLDILDIDDSLDRYEVPRIERHEEGIIMFVRHPIDDIEGLYTDILTIILTDKYIITISPDRSSIISLLLKNKIPFATTQKSRLLIKLLLLVSNSFTNHVKSVRHSVVDQKKIFKKGVSDTDIIELAENEEILNQYLSALIPLQHVIQTILRGNYIELYADDEDLLDDLLVSSRQSVDICTVNVKSIRAVRDSYQIIFTNKLNHIMKFLTSFTIVLTIPTIVTSFYGMNVHLPLEKYPSAHLMIILGTAIICAITMLIFSRKKWF